MMKNSGEHTIQRYITARRPAVCHHNQLTSIDFEGGAVLVDLVSATRRLRLVEADRMAGRPAADKAQTDKGS